MDKNLSSTQTGRLPNRNVIRAEAAIIEEVRITRNMGYVTISYGITDRFNTINMELVTLVVNQNTIIQDNRRRNLRLRDLRKGMVVDAVFSAAMTFSIPPQARAYRITVIEENRNRETTTGMVMQVDLRNRFLYTGSPRNIVDLKRFVITDDTEIFNRNGNSISLRNLRPGQRVRVEHANWQTRSIPPQTVAYLVRVL